MTRLGQVFIARIYENNTPVLHVNGDDAEAVNLQ